METPDQKQITETLYRLTERKPYRLTEAALKDLAEVLRLTIAVTRAESAKE